jgi:hypothetical protein
VRGYDEFDVLRVEGSASFVVSSVARLAANIGIDTAPTRPGRHRPAGQRDREHLQRGQPATAGGPVAVEIRLDAPDTQALPNIATSAAS